MGLGIYNIADPNTSFSQDGANNSPVRFSVDGRTGDVIERLYYVRNDDTTQDYESVALSVTPNIAIDIVNGNDGYYIKLKEGSAQPTEQEWDNIDMGNSISINQGNVVGTATYYPFWIRIVVPAGAPVQTITGMSIKISGTAV